MATVGKLVAILEAQTGEFRKGMRQASGSIDRLRKSTQKFQRMFAATFGAVGLTIGVNRLISSIDTLAKRAAKLGTTTDQLSALEFVASQVGVASNTLDQALQRLTRRLGEASEGGGEARDALKALGIDAGEFIKLPLVEQVKRISDAMKTGGLRAQQLAKTMKLVDSEGVVLINLFDLGSAEIDKMIEKARRLGIIIDKETAANVEKLSNVLDTLGKVLIGRIAPFLAEVSVKLTKMLSKVIDNIGSIARFAATLGTFVIAAKTTAVVINLVTRAYSLWATATKGVVSAQAALIAILGGPKGIAKVVASLAVGVAAAGAVNEALGAVGADADELGMKIEALDQEIQDVTASTDEFGRSLHDLDSEADAWLERLAAFADQMRVMALGEVHALQLQMDRLSQAIELNQIDAELGARAMEILKEKMREATGEAEREREALRKLNEEMSEARGVIRSVESPLERMNRELARLEELAKKFPKLITPEIFRKAAEEIRKAFEKTTEAFKEMERLRDLAAQVIDSTRTPLERFEKKMRDLKRLLEEELIDEETFRRKAEQLRKELEAATGGAERDQSFGTARSIREIQFGRKSRTEQLQEKEVKIAEEVNRRMAELVRRMGGPIPVEISLN